MEEPTPLLEHHAQLLSAVAIPTETAAARGYRSATTKAELTTLGFRSNQCSVPSLLFPVRDHTGKVVLYGARPDDLLLCDGKPAEYAYPRGTDVVIDVPAAARAAIADVERTLVITADILDADAAVARGGCAIAVLRLWDGDAARRRKRLNPALWKYFALKKRPVCIIVRHEEAQDSKVHDALNRFRQFLRERGSETKFICLPEGAGGTRLGLSDYLAEGHSMDEALALAKPHLPKLPTSDYGASAPTQPQCEYEQTKRGLIWHKPFRDDTVPVRLTNFAAQITADIIEDDGADTRRVYRLTTQCNGRVNQFPVVAREFHNLNWVPDQMGAQALVFPGQAIRDHARAAIQMLSGEPPLQTVHTHTGWKQLANGSWAYLHAGGAIGHDCHETLHVQLDGGLERFLLPTPPTGATRKRAVRASLALLDLGPPRISYSIVAAVYRAVVGTSDSSLFLGGPSSAFKSETAALAQQHSGSGLDARHLPGSWSSTDNTLEAQAFRLKDAMFVIDDFAPRGCHADIQALHAKADRVLRGQGNNSGRGRMRSDGSLHPPKPPRGLIVATGEDLPQGYSLGARLWVVEFSPGDIPADRLTVCQKHARDGLYAQSLAAFILWLSSRYGEVQSTLRQDIENFRAAVSSPHRRTPEIVANLFLGLHYFLTFAQEVGALTPQAMEQLRDDGWAALQSGLSQQAQHQVASEPAARYMELLAAAVASGKAHLATLHGTAPTQPQAFGWRWRTYGGENNQRSEWEAQGEHIGWVDGDDLYLIPAMTYNLVHRMGRESGDAIAISSTTLSKRLREKGHLMSTESGRQSLTVRKIAEGARHNVLHLHTRVILGTAPPEEAGPEEVPPEEAR